MNRITLTICLLLAISSIGTPSLLNKFKLNKFTNFLQKGFKDNENPANFLEDEYITHIGKIPTTGASKITPWSGSFWGVKSGVTSARYALNEKNSIGEIDPNTLKFKEIYDYKESVTKYQQPQEHNKLVSDQEKFQKYVNAYYSPAEKYDLLVGDTSYTLTNMEKQLGQRYLDREQEIPKWIGVDHGWAPASYFFQAPKKPVVLTAADGKTKIVFLQDDIKALASLFWANSKYTTKFLGEFCSDCSSVNPGAFVIALANHIGKEKKNFVFDPKADTAMWNQPVNAYKISYFNPLNSKNYSRLAYNLTTVARLAKTRAEKLKNIAANASDKAKFVVGASIIVQYIFENTPVHSTKVQLPTNKKTETYLAALELDEEYNIVGGHWLKNEHPNFIWHPSDEFEPMGAFDTHVESFNGSVEQLKKITPYAKRASQSRQVLKALVEYLVGKSSA